MVNIVLAFAAVSSVLAFGGVGTLGFAPAQIAVGILATAVFWQRGFPRLSVFSRLLLAMLIAIPLFQIVSLPRSIGEVLSPARVALADQLQNWLPAAPASLALTVNSYETGVAFSRLVCYVLVFLLAMQSFRVQGNRAGLLRVLIGLGIFEAAYGIFQYLTKWHYIFLYAKKVNTYVATGTYINPNHYAGLLEMVLPFVLAVLLLRRPPPGGNARPLWIRAISSPLTFRSLRDLVLVAIISTGLVFSRSRMGIAAAIAGLLLVSSIAILQNKRRTTLVLVLLVVLLPAVYSLWIGLNPVVQKFEELGRPGALEQNRLPIWRDSLAMIQDYPLLGTGLGTYSWAGLRYQSDMLDRRYEHAHNDYLEFAADIGVPAAILLFGSLWVLLAKVARKALTLPHSRDRILAAGCAGSLLAILLHEVVDFNLQIPANALLFSWIAGTAAAIVQKPQPNQSSGEPE